MGVNWISKKDCVLIVVIHSNTVLAWGIQALCDHSHEEIEVMSLFAD